MGSGCPRACGSKQGDENEQQMEDQQAQRQPNSKDQRHSKKRPSNIAHSPTPPHNNQVQPDSQHPSPTLHAYVDETPLQMMQRIASVTSIQTISDDSGGNSDGDAVGGGGGGGTGGTHSAALTPPPNARPASQTILLKSSPKHISAKSATTTVTTTSASAPSAAAGLFASASLSLSQGLPNAKHASQPQPIRGSLSAGPISPKFTANNDGPLTLSFISRRRGSQPDGLLPNDLNSSSTPHSLLLRSGSGALTHTHTHQHNSISSTTTTPLTPNRRATLQSLSLAPTLLGNSTSQLQQPQHHHLAHHSIGGGGSTTPGKRSSNLHLYPDFDTLGALLASGGASPMLTNPTTPMTAPILSHQRPLSASPTGGKAGGASGLYLYPEIDTTTNIAVVGAASSTGNGNSDSTSPHSKTATNAQQQQTSQNTATSTAASPSATSPLLLARSITTMPPLMRCTTPLGLGPRAQSVGASLSLSITNSPSSKRTSNSYSQNPLLNHIAASPSMNQLSNSTVHASGINGSFATSATSAGGSPTHAPMNRSFAASRGTNGGSTAGSKLTSPTIQARSLRQPAYSSQQSPTLDMSDPNTAIPIELPPSASSTNARSPHMRSMSHAKIETIFDYSPNPSSTASFNAHPQQLHPQFGLSTSLPSAAVTPQMRPAQSTGHPAASPQRTMSNAKKRYSLQPSSTLLIQAAAQLHQQQLSSSATSGSFSPHLSHHHLSSSTIAHTHHNSNRESPNLASSSRMLGFGLSLGAGITSGSPNLSGLGSSSASVAGGGGGLIERSASTHQSRVQSRTTSRVHSRNHSPKRQQLQQTQPQSLTSTPLMSPERMMNMNHNSSTGSVTAMMLMRRDALPMATHIEAPSSSLSSSRNSPSPQSRTIFTTSASIADSNTLPQYQPQQPVLSLSKNGSLPPLTLRSQQSHDSGLVVAVQAQQPSFHPRPLIITDSPFSTATTLSDAGSSTNHQHCHHLLQPQSLSLESPSATPLLTPVSAGGESPVEQLPPPLNVPQSEQT